MRAIRATVFQMSGRVSPLAMAWGGVAVFFFAATVLFVSGDPWRKARVCFGDFDAACFLNSVSEYLDDEVDTGIIRTAAWGHDLAHAAFESSNDRYLTDVLSAKDFANVYAEVALRELAYLSVKEGKYEQAVRLWEAMEQLNVEPPDLEITTAYFIFARDSQSLVNRYGEYFDFLERINVRYPSLEMLENLAQANGQELSPGEKMWLAERYSEYRQNAGTTRDEGGEGNDIRIAKYYVTGGLSNGRLSVVTANLSTLGDGAITPAPTAFAAAATGSDEPVHHDAVSGQEARTSSWTLWPGDAGVRWDVCARGDLLGWFDGDEIANWRTAALNLALEKENWDVALDLIRTTRPPALQALLMERAGSMFAHSGEEFVETLNAIRPRLLANSQAGIEFTRVSDSLKKNYRGSREHLRDSGPLLVEGLSLIALGVSYSQVETRMGRDHYLSTTVMDSGFGDLVLGLQVALRAAEKFDVDRTQIFRTAILRAAHYIGANGGYAVIQEALNQLDGSEMALKGRALECGVFGAVDAGRIHDGVALLENFSFRYFSELVQHRKGQSEDSAAAKNPCGSNPIYSASCRDQGDDADTSMRDRLATAADDEVALLAVVLADGMDNGGALRSRFLEAVRGKMLGDYSTSLPAVVRRVDVADADTGEIGSEVFETSAPQIEGSACEEDGAGTAVEIAICELIEERKFDEAIEMVAVFDLQDRRPDFVKRIVDALLADGAFENRIVAFAQVLMSRSNTALKQEALRGVLQNDEGLFAVNQDSVSGHPLEVAVVRSWGRAAHCDAEGALAALESNGVNRSVAIETATQVLPLLAACRDRTRVSRDTDVLHRHPDVSGGDRTMVERLQTSCFIRQRENAHV